MSKGTSQQIASDNCCIHGHIIAIFEKINTTMCTKCGMTLDEIRNDIGKTPVPIAA